MSGAKQTPEGDPNSGSNIVNRLHFLYQVVEDSQNTIRFIDTKAVFCVTLLSGMAAVVLQRPHDTPLDHILLPGFLAIIVLSLLVCMRVIFPTIKPSGSFGAPAEPKFYIGHNKAHHWIKHTISNKVVNALSENHTSYQGYLDRATDNDLLSSLVDTVLMLALIRQIKSDRLHTAFFCLMGSVMFFAAIVLF
jgi:hypothetical protein